MNEVIKPSFELEVSAQINGIAQIESNMEAVKERATEIREWYENLVITEDMLEDIKNEKAEINKAKDSVATYRKNIVKEFKKPIEQFETLAKETEKILGEAYTTCNNQVKKYEEAEKARKSEEVRNYFNEYAKSLHIDFVTYEQAGINVNLSSSLKSLKVQAKDFLDKINSDLTLISTQDEELINEILVEYKSSLNASDSIVSVKKRHKALEEEKARQEALNELKAKEIEQEKKVEEAVEVMAPQEIVEEPKPQMYKATFTVTGTIDQLRLLKDFMNKEGIKYEQCN